MYAVLGGLMFMMAADPIRYRQLLRFLGATIMLFGVALLGIDIRAALPDWWIVGEGPFTIVLGIAIIWLAGRLPANS